MIGRKFVSVTAGALLCATLPPGLAYAQKANPVYDNNCALCHQPKGEGAPGVAPRLTGRAAAMAGDKLGRRYLGQVVLNGMIGKITTDNQTMNGVMPAFSSLSDRDVASVLNHMVKFGGTKAAPFTEAEVKGLRSEKRSSADMAADRRKLSIKGL